MKSPRPTAYFFLALALLAMPAAAAAPLQRFNITDNILEIVERDSPDAGVPQLKHGSLMIVVKNETDRKLVGGLLEAVIPELFREPIAENDARYPNIYTVDEFVEKMGTNYSGPEREALRAQTTKDLAGGNFAVVHRWIHFDDPEKKIVLKRDIPPF